MAVLERLSIRGIRSFGPNDEEKVKFSTPLTLFLGQNGCGKTTIIESIKYAFTGELPGGTSSGSGFVNDPKLSNKISTKASIKVKFRDCKGDFVTVGKFMEVLTRTEGKLQFKSMSPSIRWEDGKGIKQAEDISGRCANIDAYCAQKLNVSKAIINNVIFCHQENAAWPLEEAKKLKEKFDEIFGSTEYNKCVDRLRKIIKDKKNSIRVLKEQFEAKKLTKRNVERLKDSLSAKEEQLQSILVIIEQKENEIAPLEERIRQIGELENVLMELHQNLAGLQKTLEGVVQQQQSLKNYLVNNEYEGTDEQLENEIVTFKDNQGRIEKIISEMDQKKKQIEITLIEVNKHLQTLQVNFGQLKEEENQHKKRCEEMNNLIETAKVKLNVVAANLDCIADVLREMKAAIKNEETIFNKFKQDNDNKEKKLQKAIDDVRVKFASAKENLSSTDKAVSDFEVKVRNATLKLGRLATSNSQLEVIERKIKNLEESLANRRAGFNEYRQNQEIDELDTSIQQKEQTQTKLEREHRILQQNYVAEQAIDREKSLIIEKNGEIDNIKEKHEENFSILFGENTVEDHFEQSVRRIQIREDEKVKTLSKSISNYEKNITSLEATLKYTKEKLQNQKEELKVNQNKVNQFCKGKSFAEVLQESYNRKEKLQKDKGTYRSAKTLFEEFINQFEQENPCCPVCETDFSGKQRLVPHIVRRLKSKIAELPNKLVVIEKDLKKEEELYNKLQQLKPASKEIEILQEAKIPLLEQELQETTEKLDDTKIELASLKNDLIEPQRLVDTCKKVVSDAALLDRLLLDLNKSKNSVKTLKQELVHVPSNRTLDQTETELTNIKAELSNLRRQYKTKRDVFDQSKQMIQSVNANLQTEIQKKLEGQKLLQEKPLIEGQLKEYKDNINKLKQEKKALIDIVDLLTKELKQAENNRHEVVQTNKIQMEKKRSELESHKRIVDDIQKLHKVVERYEHGESKNKLGDILKDLQTTKDEILKLENAKKSLSDTILKKREALMSQESKLRALNDNKELRENKKKGKKLEKEISDLKKQIGNQNSKTIFEEKKRVLHKIDSKRHEISLKMGEQRTLQAAIKEVHKELNTKENREALKEFMKKYYELRVEQLTVDDLELYTRALEKSILVFHKERMVQINETIRELWRTIYKGNDIDYIEIKTDDEIGSGGNKKRSYIYKVVEVKKGVELEMRGRCSAGQKVLACLVIRIALAETFSANCGILALDEPTTNLDRDNISSLSDALSKIITTRQNQKNFQLLVITHDEEFLQTLTRDKTVSHYYRVQRNADGFSQIKKEVL